MTKFIQVAVDDQVAEQYEAASDDDKRTIDLLLSIWLREVNMPKRPLIEVMDDIGEKAQARGLTPAILEDIVTKA